MKLALLLLAHSWYSWECCSAEHCRPVEVVEQATAWFIPEISLVVPKAFPGIKISRDGLYHVCIVGGKLTCFYKPGEGV